MHSSVYRILLHFLFGILSLQDPRHFVYCNGSFESQLPRDITQMNSLSSSRTLKLYNRASSKHLRIMPERVIDAKGLDDDEYARLIIMSEGLNGQVTIKGEVTDHYLCMNKKGNMVGRRRIKQGGSVTCVFTETILSGYTEFRPVQKTDWFIGFTRHGDARRVDRCRPGSRSVQFLKRPVDVTTPTPETDLQIIAGILEELFKKGNS